MNVPEDLRYTESHEWIRVEGENARVGITDHAQAELTDVVFVELPKMGAAAIARGQIAVVESVKAASDIYAPVSGEVVAVNQAVADAPESINADAYSAWLYKLKPSEAGAIDGLLDAAAYGKSTA